MIARLVVMAVAGFGCIHAVGAAGVPVVRCPRPGGDWPGAGEGAPASVPFGDGQAWAFAGSHALWQVSAEALARLRGPLTMAAAVQVGAIPETKSPVLSKWHCVDGGRSFELGVMPDGRVYMSISASGSYDAHAREVYSRHALRAGTPYALVAAFEPGRRLSLWVNGVASGTLTERVPKGVAETPTPVLICGRHPNQLHLRALVADVALFDSAFGEQEARAWAAAAGIVADPGPPQPSLQVDVFEAAGERLQAVRTITTGPAHHWFGYYDKLQFDASGRYVLGMEVDFEHRGPRPEDEVRVGMVDLHDGDRWIELGRSTAWCWQQGCMLQWRPGHDHEVLWNDRIGDRFVCRVLNVKTGEARVLPRPIHHVSPDGKWALCTDVARVGWMRPGYGYVGVPDPNRGVFAPADSGLWRMHLDSGEVTMLLSIADIAAIPYAGRAPASHQHYLNHIQWSPDGRRFLFLNRGPGVGTRMFTAAADGTDIRLVMRDASHYVWRDPESILVWSGGAYRLYHDDGSQAFDVLWQAPNGHQSYLPGGEWLITDTYPRAPDRTQHLYLHHLPTGRFVPVARFHAPSDYRGEWRCDLHPRLDRSGRIVCVDAPHGNAGRQLHLVDLTPIVNSEN